MEKDYILIIEDSKTYVKVITELIKEYTNYKFIIAYNYAEAKAILETREYNFFGAISDLHLPDAMDGKVINLLFSFDIPPIILTSDITENMRNKFVNEPIIDYIIKESISDIKSAVLLLNQLKNNQNIKVLIVDDSRTFRRYISNYLGLHKFKTLEAMNGREALKIIEEDKNISLVLTDYHMPDMNGYELTKAIRKKYSKQELAIIALSSDNNAFMTSKFLKQGANDYLLKSFSKDEFFSRVYLNIENLTLIKNLKKEQNLLKEYKKAVDRSAIVSKTDKRGIITYVNKEFCRISGYKKDELIGKPHNIVRHSDMPSSAFEDMWETIQAKRPWQGIVKNKTKDGGAYWVDSFINPILDENRNIVEFIAIRNDITDIQELKEKLQRELNITTSNFHDVLKLSEEYERAIDESNILSRSDLEGNITYANKEFFNITGYSEDEIIGKKHNIVKHPDNSPELFKNLWNTLKAGKVWKGIIKNKKRDGSTYWVDSVILPIKNTSGEIVEYMAIRHDVTQIIELTNEIEDTQKEVVFTMGAIGETRSKETGNHVKRVAEYSKILALKYGLSEDEAELLKQASPMHDIGKVGIPDAILNKPGRFNDEEFEIMKTHSQLGYEMLKYSKREILKASAIVAYEHHEKYNGKGYPRGISGKDIHIYGRITAVADVFDALGSDRCYKKAWDDEKIFKLLKDERGEHFDPKLIDIFFENLNEFLKIRDTYKDI